MNSAAVNPFFQAMNLGQFGQKVKNEVGQVAAGVDLEHPVFEGVFAKKTPGRKFDAPTAYQYYDYRPSNGAIQNVILRLGNGSPILVVPPPISVIGLLPVSCNHQNERIGLDGAIGEDDESDAAR